MAVNLSEIIFFHRKKSGLTQKQLATLAGVGKNVIYELESGKQTIRLDTLLKILIILNIEIDFRSPLGATFMQEQRHENG